jgi:hypothetical protein
MRMFILIADQITNRSKGKDVNYECGVVIYEDSIKSLSDSNLLKLRHLVSIYFDREGLYDDLDDDLYTFLNDHFREVQDIIVEFGGAMKYLDIGIKFEPAPEALKMLNKEIESRDL